MELARKLKQNSLFEYLLLMYQVEDIIRACNFDKSIITKVAEQRFGSELGDRDEGIAWFLAMSEMMQEEKIEQKYHLQHVVNLTNDLFQLHLRLVNAPSEEEYHELYVKVGAFVEELRQKGNSEENVVSIFLTAIYGVWLLDLKNVSVSNETRQAVEDITNLLALLSKYYRQIEAGEKELPG